MFQFRTFFILVGMLCIGSTTFAQDEDEVFVIVEQMPEFPGGENALFEYLGTNIKYPEEAKDKGIQGKVYVEFVIEKDGAVSNVKVLRGIGGGCDEESARVIKEMPKWIPGQQRGELVRVQFRLPIQYTLTDLDDPRDKVYPSVDVKPTFPGGEAALDAFIQDNLDYPQEAIDAGVEGTVEIRLIVRKDGSISKPIIMNGLNSECDAEAMRLVWAMPKWIPGKLARYDVSAYRTLTITFNLKNANDGPAAFPGGTSAMNDYFEEKVKRPKNNTQEGVIVVGATVSEKGELSDLAIVKGLNADLDKAALKAIKKMPSWNPRILDGDAIESKVTFEVNIQQPE